MMDEPTLGVALRSRPASDPTYRPGLDPELPGARVAHTVRARRGSVWAGRLATIAIVATLAAGGAFVVGSMRAQPSPTPGPLNLLSSYANGRIAYDRDGDIWIAEADGSGAHPITSGPTWDRAPSWSPDGQWIAYWQGDDRDVDLRAVHPDGTDDQLVAPGPLDPLEVAWVPASYHTLAYTVLQPWPEIGSVIVQQTVTREGREALVAPGVAPAFGPDGDLQMAYLTSRTSGTLAIWTAMGGTVSLPLGEIVEGGPSEPGSPPYRLDRPERLGTPAWDPLGRSVALAAGTATDRDIVIVDVLHGGGGPRWSTTWDEWSPTWSPDGTQLAWLRDEALRTVIQVVAADGSSQASPLQVDDNATAIAWAPDGTGWLLARPGAIDLLMPRADGQDRPIVTIDAPLSSGVASWERVSA